MMPTLVAAPWKCSSSTCPIRVGHWPKCSIIVSIASSVERVRDQATGNHWPDRKEPGLRALGLGAAVIDVLDREVELVVVALGAAKLGAAIGEHARQPDA